MVDRACFDGLFPLGVRNSQYSVDGLPEDESLGLQESAAVDMMGSGSWRSVVRWANRLRYRSLDVKPITLQMPTSRLRTLTHSVVTGSDDSDGVDVEGERPSVVTGGCFRYIVGDEYGGIKL